MRSALVTGAYGLLGTWLVRRLLDEGVEVTVLRRDVRPRSALTLLGLESRVNVVTGDVTDLPLMERTLGGYEVDSVFHLAAQTIVGTANRSPLDDLGDQRARYLGGARGLSPPGARAGGRGRLRQGLRRPRASCPTARTARSWRAFPTTPARRRPT